MRSCSMLLVLAYSVLTGCTVLHSSSDPADGGITYHLPRSVIVAKVDLWRIPRQPNVEGSVDKYVVAIDAESAKTRGETIPDLKERFTLTYNNNPFFYDRYCVLTSENGLLRSVEYATEDKTPNVVLALSELGRKVGAAGFASSRPVDADTQDPVTSAAVTFNPFDPEDRDAAAQVVNNTFGTHVVDGRRVNKVNVRFDFPELRHHFSRHQESNKCRSDKGLCFRTKIKTPLRMWDGMARAYTASVLVEVVNPAYVGHFDLDRAFMVEKVVRLGFDDGALNQVIMRKPSEMLQTVKLPLAVVDALLAVPANFISTAAGNTQMVNDRLQAQRDEIDALHAQLAATAVADRPEENIYRPKCKGRAGLFNP
jgi:hypothetical protein